MKKHGAVLDMRNDRLSFWPGHYQHDVALKLLAGEPQVEKLHDKKPCAEKQSTKPPVEKPPSHAEKPHANRPVKILKRLSNERLAELLPYLLPSTQGVSKVAITLEAIEPKKKKKPSSMPRKL